MGNTLKIILIISVIIIQGCATTTSEVDEIEKPGKLIVSKQFEISGFAHAIEFEMINGQKRMLIDYPLTINLNKEGIYGINKTGIFGPFDFKFKNNLIDDSQFIKEGPIYFKYSKGQEIQIRLGTKSPTQVTTFDKSGKVLTNKALKREKAMHQVHAYPNNVTVMIPQSDGTRRTIHDNSKSTNWNSTQSFNLEIDALTSDPMVAKVVVRWNDFDFEVEYEAQLIKGLTTEKNVSPTTSSKFLEWKSTTMLGQDRVNFICTNGLHTIHKEFDKCIEYERSAQLEIEKLRKQEALLREIEEKLGTREGIECKSKINEKNKERQEAFLACVVDAGNRNVAAMKYAEASKSEEGAFCNKITKKDNAEFWKCYEERLSISKLIKADEVASQCASIGFEYASAAYKDCYLKLKMHTEQIGEWRRLQESLNNQTANRQPIVVQQSQSTNIDDSAKYLDIAQRAFNSMGSGGGISPLSPPPPPVRIVTPIGNSYNCSMMGAALRCR